MMRLLENGSNFFQMRVVHVYVCIVHSFAVGYNIIRRNRTYRVPWVISVGTILHIAGPRARPMLVISYEKCRCFVWFTWRKAIFQNHGSKNDLLIPQAAHDYIVFNHSLCVKHDNTGVYADSMVSVRFVFLIH